MLAAFVYSYQCLSILFAKILNQSFKAKFRDRLTFASLPLEQTVSDELGAACLQGRGLTQGAAVQSFSLHLLLTAQLWRVEGQSSKEQPGVVMDVGLDQAVTVADSYGHHGVHCDPVGGQVAKRQKHYEIEGKH